MKISKRLHIRKTGTGKGKVRHNPKKRILYKTETPATPGISPGFVVARIQPTLPIPMILLDNAMRNATNTKLNMVVTVKHGINTAPALIQKQYRDLIGSNKVTLAQALATSLDANEGDRIEIVGPAPQADKERIMAMVQRAIQRQRMAMAAMAMGRRRQEDEE